MIGAFADLALLSTEDGGIRSSMHTPCRSLLLRVDGGSELGPVMIGVQISTESGEPIAPGASIVHAQFDFWADVAEVYIAPGQAFELCYPNDVVARGMITSVFPVTPA